MLDIKQIAAFYPEHLRPFKRNLLREYLQYKILEIINDSKHGNKLSFMGGTAIRIIYGNARFSEDLDFDNTELNENDFQELSNIISRKLNLQGYKVELRLVLKKAFRMYIRIPEILYENRLSDNKKEKLHIQVDTESQRFNYIQDRVIINKFDVFQRIIVVPEDIILAQKLLCIFKRRRPMGRDFYDVIFLLGKTRPNYKYLGEKIDIKDGNELKEHLRQRCSSLDFKQLAGDVRPFLFNPSDAKKILMFKKYIEEFFF